VAGDFTGHDAGKEAGHGGGVVVGIVDVG